MIGASVRGIEGKSIAVERKHGKPLVWVLADPNHRQPAEFRYLLSELLGTGDFGQNSDIRFEYTERFHLVEASWRNSRLLIAFERTPRRLPWQVEDDKARGRAVKRLHFGFGHEIHGWAIAAV